MPVRMKKQCYFETGEAGAVLDYKNVDALRKFLSTGMKIRSRKKTGLCAKHQRGLARAVAQARIAGLVPFVAK